MKKILIITIALAASQLSGCATGGYGYSSINSIPPIGHHSFERKDDVELLDTTCWHDGKKYSGGAVIKIGGVSKECGLGMWSSKEEIEQRKNSPWNNSTVFDKGDDWNMGD